MLEYLDGKTIEKWGQSLYEKIQEDEMKKARRKKDDIPKKSFILSKIVSVISK